jgi:transcriptional regulator with XRE-family HTH domain
VAESGAQTLEPFGKALARIMEERGLTQEALSYLTPYNQATINRYLKAKRGRQINEETVTTMSDIAVALALDPEYFLEVRIYRAWQQVERDMRDGLITLEDLTLLAEGARLRQRAQGHEASD